MTGIIWTLVSVAGVAILLLLGLAATIVSLAGWNDDRYDIGLDDDDLGA